MRAEITRREYLESMARASAAALAMGYVPEILAAETEKPPKATADCMIVLWMAGGMAHTETFDPKHYEPFAPGIESKRVLSTFPAIPTSVDGIQFTSGLEEMASVMHQGSLIKTFNLPIVDKITHSRHQYHWHTGYLPPQSVAAPNLGAVLSRALGPRHPELPPYIVIGDAMSQAGREARAIRSYLSAGFLGIEHGPFMIPAPDQAARQLASAIGVSRHENRMRAFRELVKSSPVGELGSSYQQESMLKSIEQAYRLMKSPVAKTFDLAEEPKSAFDAYNTGQFGLGCLLARRLVEAGARYIEVQTAYKPFGYWDTHENGHAVTAAMKQEIDRPIAQLIRDLDERGLLSRTLIVLASEFSRDVLVEGKENQRARVGQAAIAPTMPSEKHYGMHAHFAEAGSILLWGGGVKRGFVYGETADEHPCKTVKNPVVIEDLHATLYQAMGISPKHSYEIERRPFYVTRDGVGKPILDLFA